MKPMMLLCSLLTALSTSAAVPMQGKVVGVTGGASLEILVEGKVLDIRIHGTACMARDQALGKAARKRLASLAFMETVRIDIVSTASHGELVAQVYLADGTLLGQEMIKSGLAWWDKASTDSTPVGVAYARVEADARAAYLGVWAFPEDEEGTDWRKEILAQREEGSKGMTGLLTLNH